MLKSCCQAVAEPGQLSPTHPQRFLQYQQQQRQHKKVLSWNLQQPEPHQSSPLNRSQLLTRVLGSDKNYNRLRTFQLLWTEACLRANGVPSRSAEPQCGKNDDQNHNTQLMATVAMMVMMYFFWAPWSLFNPQCFQYQSVMMLVMVMKSTEVMLFINGQLSSALWIGATNRDFASRSCSPTQTQPSIFYFCSRPRFSWGHHHHHHHHH